MICTDVQAEVVVETLVKCVTLYNTYSDVHVTLAAA